MGVLVALPQMDRAPVRLATKIPKGVRTAMRPDTGLAFARPCSRQLDPG